MSDVVIRCDNVSKKFCRDFKKSLWYGVKDSAADLCRLASSTTMLRKGEFWANEDLSFELKRGDSLGLIGRNGAGKTTLLKMLNGLLKPDKGNIEVRGRVGALIALGAGFNPVLSGRENIYVNGIILGFSQRQIRDIVDDIVEFAELADSIDAPVRTYSSGMAVRLGFAVAAQMQPDILLIDEVLAVGDTKFRVKCYNRLNELRRVHGTAFIIVSHSEMTLAAFASKGLLLKSGKRIFYGEIADAMSHYATSYEDGQETILSDPVNVSDACQLICIDFDCEAGTSGTLVSGKPADIRLDVRFAKALPSLDVSVLIRPLGNMSESVVISGNFCVPPDDADLSVHCVELHLDPVVLAAGEYTLKVSLMESGELLAYIAEHRFEVTSDRDRQHSVLQQPIEWHKRRSVRRV